MSRRRYNKVCIIKKIYFLKFILFVKVASIKIARRNFDSLSRVSANITHLIQMLLLYMEMS